MALTPDVRVELGPSRGPGPPSADTFPPPKAWFRGGGGLPDVVVTSGDWPKVWTRWKDPRKEIVVREPLTPTACRRGGLQKAASQAGLGLRLRNIFRLF